MMQMLIKLDEERVKADGKYDLADMWRKIDERFEACCVKEVLQDGSAMYTGDDDKDYFTDMAAAYILFSESEWFTRYCTKWMWYSNDDDEDLPMSEINVLTGEDSVAEDRKCRKGVYFEFDTSKAKGAAPDAYGVMKKALESRGFKARGDLGYVSEKKLDDLQVTKIIDSIFKENTWLTGHITKFEVTNIGEEINMTDFLKKIAAGEKKK